MRVHIDIEIECGCCPKTGQLRIPIGPFSEQKKGSFNMPQSVNMTNTQKFSIGPVTATDQFGNPIPLGGRVSVTSSDTGMLSIMENIDGTFEAVAGAGATGTVTITVTDTVLTDTIAVTFITAAPVETTLVIPVGAPVAQ